MQHIWHFKLPYQLYILLKSTLILDQVLIIEIIEMQLTG